MVFFCYGYLYKKLTTRFYKKITKIKIKKMKNITTFLTKYKFYLVTILLLLIWVRSCSKSGNIRKLTKVNTELNQMILSKDSTNNLHKQIIDSFQYKLHKSNLSIHQEYDLWISQKDRGQQLMELHMIVKDNIRKLNN